MSTWDKGDPHHGFLVDTDTWRVVDRSNEWGVPIAVTNGGTIYASSRASHRIIERKPVESETWSAIGEIPQGYWVGELTPVGGDRFAGPAGLVVGGATEDTLGPALLLTIDDEDGSMSTVPLPTVLTGWEETDVSYRGFQLFRSYRPAVAWAGDRAFVAHAHQDVVTEVDLATGTITDHPYRAQTFLLDLFVSWLTPKAQAKGPNPTTVRSIVATPDGSRLFISGYERNVSSKDGALYEMTTLLGVQVVDTKTWRVVATLDLPVGRLTASPDGSTIFGTGSTRAGRVEGEYTFWGAGVYLIDPSTFDVIHFDQGSDWETRVDFSRDGRYAYFTYSTSASSLNQIDALDSVTWEVIESRAGIGLDLTGPAAALNERIESPAPDR